MQYTKPPLSLDEQADLLLSRGMDGDKPRMIERLAVVSYYRLSGYWYPFRDLANPGDRFQRGTTFEEVWSRYVFDRRFRLLVMDAIERIEITMRSQLAYHHSRKHGAFAYATNPASLPKADAPHFNELLESIRREGEMSKENFVKHFRTKYGDCHQFLPIWMATETMNFGTVLTIYTYCSNDVKDDIGQCFGVSSKVLTSWLLTLNAVRNICAHHSRLWNKELGVKPSIPKPRHQPDWHRPIKIENGRLFAVLSICRYLLKKIAPQSNWHKRLYDLLAEYPNIPLDQMGFPNDWRTSPIWTDEKEAQIRPEKISQRVLLLMLVIAMVQLALAAWATLTYT